MALVRQPFVLACYDTSLGAGALSSDWVPTLRMQAPTFPEAKGPVVVHCRGHGGWNSNDLLANIQSVINLQPTHVWAELGAINDCPDFGGGPAVSLATKNANNTSMLNQLLAGVAGVNVTCMTMSSVSAIQTARATLPTYYAAELALAQSMGLNTLDLYPNWPKPLDPSLTHGAAPFAVTPTAGFSGLADGTTWDPLHTAASLSLDSTLFTAISLGNGGGSGANGVTLATSAVTGKVHFEIKVTNLFGDSRPIIGLANTSESLTAQLGAGANSIGMYAAGDVRISNAVLGSTGFSTAAGDTIAVEYDGVAKRAYFMKGAVRSAGFDVSGITGSLYPALGLFTPGAAITARFNPDGDGLHPLAAPVQAYSFPAWVALIRAQMAAYWPN